ncbi:cellobiose phosphorylase [Anaerotaenia torta]|uniref:GH36-type glycosyl hydrolase domain-containing protein n=1 Tax=Anaerotaenia torta TaxID=433293 RepID=UPI003D1AC80F
MKKLGYFSENGSEYVITQTDAPRPLLNYLWNSRIMSGINHFGGGVGAYGAKAAAYIDSEGKGRATLIRDGNRYFYVREEETGEFWNPGWYPAKKPLEEYKCIHGLGYSSIAGASNEVKLSARVFVNAEDPVELWTLSLKNESNRPRKLKVYSFVEFSLEGYARYSEYDSYVSCEFDVSRNMIVAHNTAQERPHDWFDGFIASSAAVTGFDTSKRAFLGTYGDITAPLAVTKGQCSGSLAACELMVGALENSFVLDAGEEVSYHVLIGSTNSTREAGRMVEKLLEPGKIEGDFEKLLASKKKMKKDITVSTSVEKINHITNIWVKQQVQLCAEAGRATGKGFRDQLQDSWAVAAFNQELARIKILETLKHEYSDGRCVRGWLPLDHHIYSDGPTWISPAVNAYIKETGDFGFLDTKVSYLDEGEGTVWEHILTAVRYSSEDLGERGLVLAHDGDWNDSLNGIGVGGKGESVWTSIALYYALLNTAEIAREVKKDASLHGEMLERAGKIKSQINETGWDGDWYLAAYNDDGEKVGTHTEKEGSIYLNSQTWAVMTGVAEGERVDQCFKAIDEKLDSLYGPLTLYPPYTSYKPSIGRLTGFVPGIWENGTPYCHGGTFKIVADCCKGRGNEAYQTLMKIMPDSDLNPSGHSGCEPYVFTNMYFGPDNPRAGETAFAWVTGTAGWMFRSVTQYMLGFHPDYDSFTINPCIPEDWETCSMRRLFRGDIYQINIINRNRSQYGIANITVDGRLIEGNNIKLFGDGKEHHIIVEMK